MKPYISPAPPPKNLLCSADDYGGACSLCGCGNQPPMHCMYCLRDLSDELIEELKLYREKCGPQPYVETRQDGYYLIWDGEVGPFPTPREAFEVIGITI